MSAVGGEVTGFGDDGCEENIKIAVIDILNVLNILIYYLKKYLRKNQTCIKQMKVNKECAIVR